MHSTSPALYLVSYHKQQTLGPDEPCHNRTLGWEQLRLDQTTEVIRVVNWGNLTTRNSADTLLGFWRHRIYTVSVSLGWATSLYTFMLTIGELLHDLGVEVTNQCRVEIPVYLEVNVDSNLVAGNILRFGRALPRWDSERWLTFTAIDVFRTHRGSDWLTIERVESTSSALHNLLWYSEFQTPLNIRDRCGTAWCAQTCL